jgi:hypothetical protein
MATWSDKQLSQHKRAQGYLSTAGATLGVAALGSAGLKSKGAQKLGTKLVRVAHNRGASLRTTGKAKRAAGKAAGAAGSLTTASAGVGGVGGFNFAAIQSQESRKARVKKMDTNPFAEVAKASKVADPKVRRQIRAKDAAAGGLSAAGGVAAGLGAMRWAAGRTAVKTAGRVGQTATKGQLRAVRRSGAVSAGMTAGGLAGVGAGQALTNSADRQWAGAKKKSGVRKSEEISKVRIPFKNAAWAKSPGKGLTQVKPKATKEKQPRQVRPGTLGPVAVAGPAAAGALGAAGGAAFGGLDRPERVKQMRKKGQLVKKSLSTDVAMSPFAKAYDPERSRQKRLEGYSAGAYIAGGAAGAAGAARLKRAGSNLRSGLKSGAVSTKQLKAIGSHGGKGAALVAAGAGAVVGGKKIADHKKSRGRSYRALPLS